MPFVKLDCGILNSTLWIDRQARELFITALLMAEPVELKQAMPQLEINSLKETGWTVPPGWYGFVAAAGVGIIHRARVDESDGRLALERLGNPEFESRSTEFQGRRLVRINGGFVVLNFMAYRDRDYSMATRARRYRDRKNAKSAVQEFSEAWDAIVAFYGGMCAYCGQRPWTDIDHVLATSKGGKHEPANVVPACKSCNSSKKTSKRKVDKPHPYMNGHA